MLLRKDKSTDITPLAAVSATNLATSSSSEILSSESEEDVDDKSASQPQSKNIADARNDTETRILQAAEMEFMIKGLAGARTTSIAAAAGVTHAMLHYYFRTKESLFQRVLETKRDQLLDSLMTAFAEVSDGDILKKVGKLVTRQFEFFVSNPSMPRFVINEIMPNPERLALFAQTSIPRLMTVLSQLMAELREASSKGKICEIDPYSLIVDIIALNAFSIVSLDMMCKVTGLSREQAINMRLKENVVTILKRLKA